MMDRTHDGRAMRMLAIVDEYTRECLAIKVSRKLNSSDVIDLSHDPQGRTVSRTHASIVLRGTQWFVIPSLRSRNGTKVNDQTAKPGAEYPLMDGDRLQFGAVRLCFRIKGQETL